MILLNGCDSFDGSSIIRLGGLDDFLSVVQNDTQLVIEFVPQQSGGME
jgi:hypothetical protein